MVWLVLLETPKPSRMRSLRVIFFLFSHGSWTQGLFSVISHSSLFCLSHTSQIKNMLSSLVFYVCCHIVSLMMLLLCQRLFSSLLCVVLRLRLLLCSCCSRCCRRSRRDSLRRLVKPSYFCGRSLCL